MRTLPSPNPKVPTNAAQIMGAIDDVNHKIGARNTSSSYVDIFASHGGHWQVRVGFCLIALQENKAPGNSRGSSAELHWKSSKSKDRVKR